MKTSYTPHCDELEKLRVGMEQERTPAYGDALALARKLEREITRLKKHNKELEDKSSNDSWIINPDRMGGAFTEQEIRDSNTWR